MASSSKRFDVSKQVKYDEGIDRISALPDNILGHILSFVPAKQAVITSILSHRWKHIFTQITVFDFNGRSKYLSSSPARIGTWSKSCGSFNDFVDKVLTVCKPAHISKFRVKCPWGSECPSVDKWILFAVHGGVTELNISTHEFETRLLPRPLFICTTLVVLKLHGRFEIDFSDLHLLPHLKFLKLNSVKFSGRCSLNRFISGCPVLDNLVLKGAWEDVEVINISSPTLTSLTLNFREESRSTPIRTHLLLNLPKLLHFNYTDALPMDYWFKNLDSLEDVHIDVSLDIESYIRISEVFCDSLIELLNGVSSAKNLHLSGKCMEALNCCHKFKLPSFNRLCCLKLDYSGRYVYWRGVLLELLRSSPVLEELVFPDGFVHHEEDDDYNDKTFWSRMRTAPPCLSSQLKRITVECFQGQFNEELQIVKYLLKHGKVLTKLIIYWQFSSEKAYQVKLMELMGGKVASEGCLVEIIKY